MFICKGYPDCNFQLFCTANFTTVCRDDYGSYIRANMRLVIFPYDVWAGTVNTLFGKVYILTMNNGMDYYKPKNE